MERQFVTKVRYRVDDKNYVDVCEETISTGMRDYWLGKAGSKAKNYLFCRNWPR